MSQKSTDNVVNMLEQAGKLDDDKIQKAKLRSSELGAPLPKTLVQMGVVEEDDILEVLGENLGMETVHLGDMRIDPAALSLLPKDLTSKYHAVPIAVEDSTVKVALADPFDVQSIDTIRLFLEDKGYHFQPVIAREDEVEACISRFYTSANAEVDKILQDLSEDLQNESTTEEVEEQGNLQDYMDTISDEELSEDEGPIIKLVNLILQEALKSRASDIHFEPFETEFKVRFRIDGVLHEIQSPPARLQQAILSRVKIMAGMDLAEKRVPQDGRIQMKMQGKDIDFRVSALPGLFGPSIVLRLLDKSGVMLGLEQIGFMEENIEIFKKLIRRPNGIILITGPTGSGKTTTLYSALNTINNIDTKIITIENPVEYQIEGINQVQISEDIGLTFSAGLRSILRQSPNVILVGEIRDSETAEIAIRSALTGHLVFSTLHTNDAPGATTRLIEMGVKPFLVSSAIQAVLAQRLVRVICKDCKETYVPDPVVLEEYVSDPSEYAGKTFYRGRGCEACNYTGYRGRTAIHEVMVMSDELRQLVLDKAPIEKIRDLARQQGMRTLREDGFLKALRGDTTLLDVSRITAADEA
jgi:type II secretion system protein E